METSHVLLPLLVVLDTIYTEYRSNISNIVSNLNISSAVHGFTIDGKSARLSLI